MGEGNNKIIRLFSFIFWVLVSCVLLGLLLGELLIPSEDSGMRSYCKPLSVEWRRVYQDGTKEAVPVPGTYLAQKGERVILEADLPQSLEKMPWLCFRSSQQDMEIYIDGVLRQEYTTKHTRIFGKNSMSAYVFVELEAADAGKKLCVVTTSHSTYSGVMNEVYCGDTLGIWLHFAGQYGVQIATAVLIMILGVVCIIFCVVLRVRYKKVVCQEYLGWGMFLTALWMFSESRLRQLIFPNLSVIGNIAFVVLMILPIPFLIYTNYIQKGRYWKLYVFTMGLTLADFVLCVVLQVLNQRDFLESMVFMHATLAIAIVLVGITIFIDIKKGCIREYFLVAMGLSGMMLAGVTEVVMIYTKPLNLTGIPLSIGLLFLLVMASLKTGQDITQGEKQKEHKVAASEAKMGFLANMSHEIRTPINTVIGMNEMILRENGDENIQKYASEIHKAGNLLLTMINEILDFSKITAGTLEVEEGSYFLASLLNDVIHDIKNKAEEKGLEVLLNIDEGLPSELQGDEIRIKQVLNHLISNAVKFTEKGRVTLTIQGKWTQQGEFKLMLSIADTGMGIQKEDMGRIFDSFTKMDEKKNRAIEGTGLGLNIAKQLVDKMEGEIFAQSVYGKGSIFTVTIPQKVINRERIGNLKAAYEREVSDISHYRELFQAPNARILAVDDNQMNLVVVRNLLKKTKIQLELAFGGNEALEFTRQKKYDLILLDHMMPELDGVEVLHTIREEKGNPNNSTPIIVLTANAVSGIRDWYLKEGFDEYLAKPIVAEKLEKTIKNYLPKELVEVPEIRVEAPKQPEALPEPREELISLSVGLAYCMEDEEFYYEILQTYYEQGLGYRDKLKDLYEQQDFKELKIIVHAIKSTSLNIGSVELSGKAKAMEQYAKDENAEELQNKWQEFLSLYEQVLNRAAQMLQDKGMSVCGQQENLGGTIGREVSLEEYLKEAEVLLEHIRAYAMQEAMEQLEKLRGMFFIGDMGEMGADLKGIQEAVDGFAYDEAEEILSGWIRENSR